MGGRQPSGDTPPDISHNPAITSKLEINDSPMTPSLVIPNLEALMAIAKKIPGISSDRRCSDTGGPLTHETIISHQPRCSSPSLCLSPPLQSTHSTTDTNAFDDLLNLHSLALLDYYQKWSPETAAALEFAVFDTEDDVRYYHFATIELLNDSESRNEEHVEIERQHEQTRKDLISKHKAEADGLRLSLHENSELVAAAIMERDEMAKERDLAVLHRDELIKQLKDVKKARETDLNEKYAYQQQYAQVVEASQRAPEEIRCAQEKQRVAEAQCKEAVVLKETAMKVVDKVMKEREAARQEIEELRNKRLGSSDRDEAIRGLGLRLGDKRRRI